MRCVGSPRWYAPSLSYAPAIHGTKQAIKHRYLHPAAPLPPLPPSLSAFLHAPPRAEARARPVREACAALFAARPAPAKREPTVQPPPAAGGDSDATPPEDGSAPDDYVRIDEVGDLRYTHAASDFAALVYSTERVSETCQGMSQLLLRWLDREPPLGDVVPALHAYRSAARQVRRSTDAAGRVAHLEHVRAPRSPQVRAGLSRQGTVARTRCLARPAWAPGPRAHYRARRCVTPLDRDARGSRRPGRSVAPSTMQVTLPHDTHLVGSACNPCMDLVAFLCCDRAPPAAASAPPGLTPAQLAMRQRMLAIQARRMGVATPAAATGAQQVRRGPALKLVVWRMVHAPSCVWEVPIEPPRADIPRDAAEGVSVLGLCWSPDGTSRC